MEGRFILVWVHRFQSMVSWFQERNLTMERHGRQWKAAYFMAARKRKSQRRDTAFYSVPPETDFPK